MPGRYVFDLETDGLLPELTKIHCLGVYDLDTGKTWSFNEQWDDGAGSVRLGLGILSQADLLIGHNILAFDLPAIRKVYPNWKTQAVVRDTLVLTRLMWPHIKEDDHARRKPGEKFPKELIKPHSLAAWGYRLGNRKGDFKGPWTAWSQEMQDYMDQDVRVTVDLWKRCEKEADGWKVSLTDTNPPPGKDCVELEHRIAAICIQVENHGFRFDMAKAMSLTAKLTARRTELVEELQKAFPPEIVKTTFIPKVNNKKLGYVKNVPFEKSVTVVFNPASRQQVAARLQNLGWKPLEFGKDGTPTVDDEILSALPYPEAKVLAEFYMIEKRLGQIANGKEAWFRHERNGRIHGRIQSGGAHTGRMTHSNPNMAQVPGNHAPYGEECRDCFAADHGYALVGCDADALELRDLAGYMANWDGGAYIETILRGDKAKGTDMHTINAKLIGCTRDIAKVFFYAMIYGAGDQKLGEILGQGAAAGKRARERLMKGVPALGALIKAVHNRVETKGYLIGLDGRRLKARSKNAALNTLLQSAGAVQMKRGIVTLIDNLTEKGWEFGREYALVALVHDEVQACVQPELVQQYGETAVSAIRHGGTYYNFKCPLDAQYQAGATWKETH